MNVRRLTFCHIFLIQGSNDKKRNPSTPLKGSQLEEAREAFEFVDAENLGHIVCRFPKKNGLGGLLFADVTLLSIAEHSNGPLLAGISCDAPTVRPNWGGGFYSLMSRY